MARSFASGDYMQLPANAVFDITPATLCFWMKTTQTTTNVEVVERHNPVGGSLNGWGLVMNNAAGKLQLYGKNGSTQIFGSVNGTAIVNDGNWHHIALRLDQSTAANGNVVYVDGVQDTALTASGVWSMSGNAMRIAVSGDSFWGQYVGSIAEMAWWNVALTLAEIAALAKGIVPGRVRPGAIQFYAPFWN